MTKSIPGFEGLYSASDDGVIYSLVQSVGRRKGPLKPCVNNCGYFRVRLFGRGGKTRRLFVHRLIAELFVPNPNGYKIVNHIDANKANNAASNLEWCTQKQNIKHSHEMGRQHRDRHVKMTNTVTGEIMEYPNIVTASVSLYGNTWKLGYKMKTAKSLLREGLWVIDIE